jgi:hypothetical protein
MRNEKADAWVLKQREGGMGRGPTLFRAWFNIQIDRSSYSSSHSLEIASFFMRNLIKDGPVCWKPSI